MEIWVTERLGFVTSFSLIYTPDSPLCHTHKFRLQLCCNPRGPYPGHNEQKAPASLPCKGMTPAGENRSAQGIWKQQKSAEFHQKIKK